MSPRRPIDLSVMVEIEVLRPQEVGDPYDGIAIQHQGAEHRCFRFQIVGWHAATDRRQCRSASQVNGQAEVTINGILAVTSRCSFT